MHSLNMSDGDFFRDPLAGMTPPKSKEEPRSEVATDDRFEKTRVAIRELRDRSVQERGKMRWRRLELALVLAEATGRRMGAVRSLRWDDIDLELGSITWRAEHDKKRVKWVVSITQEFVQELKTFAIMLDAALGGFVFPKPSDPSKPMTREYFDQSLRAAEAHASLPKLDGTLWHAYRRRWATGCDAVPQVDAMYAGGWQDAGTFMSYQKATEQGLLAVATGRKSVPSVVGG